MTLHMIIKSKISSLNFLYLPSILVWEKNIFFSAMGSESGDEKCSICLGPVEQPAKPDTCTVILTTISKAKPIYFYRFPSTFFVTTT